MESPVTQRQGAIIAGVCVLIALGGILIPRSAPVAAPAAVASEVKQPPPQREATPVWATREESRVTFARTMPRTHGSQIFNNTGAPNLEMVMVAIPDGPRKVRFVQGSKPEAVRYLAETREEHDRLLLDKGPRDLDTSEVANLGPLKGRGTRRAANLAADTR